MLHLFFDPLAPSNSSSTSYLSSCSTSCFTSCSTWYWSIHHLWSQLSISSFLFWLFFVWGVKCLSCVTYSYESTQKLGFIAVTHRQTLAWSILTRGFYSIVSKCDIHLVHRFLMWKFSVNIQCIDFSKFLPRPLSRSFSVDDHSISLWIFFAISDAVTSFGRPLRCSFWRPIILLL